MAFGGAVALIVASLVWPTRIESLAGPEPDGRTGGTQWWLASVVATAAVALFLLSGRDWGLALGRSSAVDPV